MIIGIAGPIASGKSTLARALSREYSLRLIGFGEYVRHEAQARGLDTADRLVLQDLGQSLVDEDAGSFVQGVFQRAKVRSADRIVLDGVRHCSVWDEILSFASSRGSTARLIFLEMSEPERRRRLDARGMSYDQALIQDRHASEVEVHARLADRADLRLDALQERAAMLAYIGSRLELR